MEKQTVLYISYVDENELSSGSGVRPAKMLKAFRDLGYDMIVLSGEQTSKQRVQRIREVLGKIRERKPDLCYIESPTYPIMRHEDRRLIRTIHKMGIPMGYFYRDFYRRFPEEFPRRSTLSGRIKDFGLDVLQDLTDRCLKNCDIVYVPSREAAGILPYKDVRPLPPAGENHLPAMKPLNRTAIYVGGLAGAYNIQLILDAFALLDKQENRCELIVVCREKEWEQLSHPCKDADWLKVYHVSGKELGALYERASVALSAKACTPYNEFAVSVKTFEYLSYGLPQIVNRAKAITELIESEGIGLSVEPTPQAFAQALISLFEDPERYRQLQGQLRRSLLERNLWTHRARTVVEDLTGPGRRN